MKLFLVVRWGSPTDPEGPDGEDTNYLIRAATPEAAAVVADVALYTFPLRSRPVGRPVQGWCHYIVELGEDESTEPIASIVHGPWVRHAIIQADGCRAWHREAADDPWVASQELFGTTP